MTKEKTNLIKTLKDENLRAETHKYTQNLINNHKNRSLTVPNNNNIKKEIENKILNDNKTEIKENNNTDNKNNISNVDENNKIKKKKKVKKKMKIKKSDKVENAENGQKYKLLTYKSLNEIINEKKEKEKENKIEDKKTENKNIQGKNDKNLNQEKKEKKEKNKDENKIKSHNDKESEKSNNTRRDLLNSLNNLQYNFDNLMEIGVHGNKILNNKKK